jgi:hypothetical protein
MIVCELEQPPDVSFESHKYMVAGGISLMMWDAFHHPVALGCSFYTALGLSGADQRLIQNHIRLG